MFHLLALASLLAQESPLRVEGTRLLDKEGKEVLLRGVSLPAGQGDRKDLERIAREWKANGVRLPVLPGEWKQKGPDALDARLDPLLDACRELGLRAIVSWQAVGNPKTGKAHRDLPEFDASLELARAFWTRTAARHRDKAWVLFELFNETSTMTWIDLKPALEALVAEVRRAAPESVVIVPGTDWAFDLRGPAADPLQGKNILYSWHPYPLRGTLWDSCVGEAAKKLPIMATEWGFNLDAETGSRGNTDDFGLPLLRLMEERRFHWTAAAWSDKGPTPLFDAQGGATPLGRLARAWLAGERPEPRPAVKDANDYAVWLRNVDLKALGESRFDLCVIDPAGMGRPFTRNEIDQLKWSPGGPKVVLAHVLIGRAEERRAYWQKDWSSKKPDWLGAPDSEERETHAVQYWDDRWQKLVLDTVEAVIDQGFDGACLGAVDAYRPLQEKQKDERARPRMSALVVRVSEHAKRKRRGFLVFARNAEELLEAPPYFAAIDGLLRDEGYFPRARMVGGQQLRDLEAVLDRMLKAGKKVLMTEFSKEPQQTEWFFEHCKVKGYLPYVVERDLGSLVVSKGHEPD
jgi:uncharacterized protein (TIGR01370 family)